MANTRTHKHRRIVKPLGKSWGRSVQDVVSEVAARQARFELRSGKHAGKATVEVVVPVFVHVVFEREGRTIAADSRIDCHCVYEENSAGSVCICTGPGAASCDCPPRPVGPIVA